MSVTQNDLLEALRSALEAPNEDPEGAYTVVELCEATGLSVRRVRDMLKALLSRGEAEPMRVRRPGIDGRNAQVPAYRLR